MLATLLFVALAAQKEGEVDVAAYLHAHREADRALTAGKNSEARAGFEKCLELAPKNATVAYGLACARAKAGEKDAALEWLAHAVEWGYADAELALWDNDLASLRDAERFKSAIEAMRKLVLQPSSTLLVRTYDERAKSYPDDVTIDRAGRQIAVGCSGGEWIVLDALSGEESARKKIDGKVWSTSIQPDGKRVVALTYDGKIHFWTLDDSGEPSSDNALRESEKDTGWPFGAITEFDPTGQRLLVAGRAHGASLWTAAGEKLHAFEQDFGGFMGVVLVWNSDGMRIAATRESDILFFDGKTGSLLDRTLKTPSAVECIDFDPNGKWMATGHADGRLRIWDASSLELTHETEPRDDGFGEELYVSELEFSPDSKRIALTTTVGVYLQVLESDTLKPIYNSSHLGGRMGEPSGICWSPDSWRVWTSFVGGAMPIYDVDLAAAQGGPDKFEAFGGVAPRALVRGRVPKSSLGGVAVFTSYNAVTALETRTGSVRWTRVNLGRDGSMFQSPGGWFDATFDDLAELAVYRPSDTDKGTPLAKLATQLFDPKRVRAVRAGIALAPVSW